MRDWIIIRVNVDPYEVWQTIKVVVALESEFDFEFDDEMLLITKFPTVKSMVEYVESKIH